MAEINNDANCGGCDFYLHMEDADYPDGDTTQPQISVAWGHCKRFPKWERKSPGTKACGEHPRYFEAVAADSVTPGWVNSETGDRITTVDGLREAQDGGVALFAGPGVVALRQTGEVIPIDGPLS